MSARVSLSDAILRAGVYVESLPAQTLVHVGDCWLRLCYMMASNPPRGANELRAEIWLHLSDPTIACIRRLALQHARALGFLRRGEACSHYFPEILQRLPEDREGLPAFDLDYGT